MDDPNLKSVNDDEVIEYDLWISGEEDLLSDTKREEFERRYLEDEVFRAETDQMRAATAFINRNIDVIIAICGPQSESTAEEKEEKLQEIQRRLQVKNDSKKSNPSES